MVNSDPPNFILSSGNVLTKFAENVAGYKNGDASKCKPQTTYWK